MKISKSLTIATDKKTRAVTLTFVDENGTEQTIHVPPQAADLLLLGLLTTPPLRRSDGKTSPHRNPVVAYGAQPTQYENGMMGLVLGLAENAFLHLAFPKEAIPLLQQHLKTLLTDAPPPIH